MVPDRLRELEKGLTIGYVYLGYDFKKKNNNNKYIQKLEEFNM